MLTVSRKIDELGRIVLPKEMREVLQIQENMVIDIINNDDSIVIKKHVPHCCICGNTESCELKINSKYICSACVSEIKSK